MNQFCRLTSSVPSAIAVIEWQGPGAHHWLACHWKPVSSKPLQINEIRFGSIAFSNANICESVVVCRTADQCFEMHCHGGKAAVSRIEASLQAAGFRPLSSSDSRSQRDLDGIQRQALEDVQKAVSIPTTAVLLDQCRGVLSQKLREIQANIILADSPVLPKGMNDVQRKVETRPAIESLDELLRWCELGEHLIEPWKVVLAGPPNSGKSSLLNAILGYQRAIVHESAGTTRDLLLEQTSINGWPISIIDSAGVRATDDSIERIGIEGSLQAVQTSDCVLLLVPPETGWTVEHDQILSHVSHNRVIEVHTKIDLGSVQPKLGRFRVSETCARDDATIQILLGTLADVLVPEIPDSQTPIPFRASHRTALRKVRDSLETGQFADAAQGIGQLLAID